MSGGEIALAILFISGIVGFATLHKDDGAGP